MQHMGFQINPAKCDLVPSQTFKYLEFGSTRAASWFVNPTTGSMLYYSYFSGVLGQETSSLIDPMRLLGLMKSMALLPNARVYKRPLLRAVQTRFSNVTCYEAHTQWVPWFRLAMQH